GRFLLLAVGAVVGSIIVIFTPCVVAWVALLTYEDVHRLVHGGALPAFSRTNMSGLGARGVGATWLAVTPITTHGTLWLTRTLYRRFDAMVGRPVSPRDRTVNAGRDSETPDIEVSAASLAQG